MEIPEVLLTNAEKHVTGNESDQDVDFWWSDGDSVVKGLHMIDVELDGHMKN